MGKKNKQDKKLFKKSELPQAVIEAYIHRVEQWEDSYNDLREEMKDEFAMRHCIDPQELDILDEDL